MNKIIVIGEIIYDVYGKKQILGGAPLNFAINLNNLGNDVTFISSVGLDTLGNAAIKDIKKLLNSYIIKRNKYPTGTAKIILNQQKEPSFKISQKCAYDFMEPITIKGDILYFGSLILREEANFKIINNLLKQDLIEVVVDLNLREGCMYAKGILKCLQAATILKLSQEDEEKLQTLVEFKNYKLINLFNICPKLKYVIRTLGAQGAEVYTKKDYLKFKASKIPNLVSTVGAGDSFLASFIHHYLLKQDISKCMEEAILFSAQILTKEKAY